ncbi:hypothetical protein [Citrobacter pasteurii]|nr:hypothetical protein SF123566_7367 [Shigella flexneri 1235-66]CEJ63050.1 hypothetical protein [Citrobacter pasteurii]
MSKQSITSPLTDAGLEKLYPEELRAELRYLQYPLLHLRADEF